MVASLRASAVADELDKDCLFPPSSDGGFIAGNYKHHNVTSFYSFHHLLMVASLRGEGIGETGMSCHVSTIF